MKIVGVSLIMIALVSGMVGCAGSASYALAITSTEEGSVTTPGEGMFTYPEGTEVNLVATPHAGCRFVSWTGDVDTIADADAAETTITMNGDYMIMANFAGMRPVQHDLFINSTEGGVVVWPGEGVFTYAEGIVVGLVTEAEEGYSFAEWVGDVGTIADVYASSTTITVVDNYSITAEFGYTPMVAAGNWHTVGLVSSGRVVATGKNDDGQCDVGGWAEIRQVAAGYSHTVGLRSDGTAVAVGFNGYGQCDISNWTDIVKVAAGEFHTVGIKSDGTAVAVGRNSEGQCDISDWRDIIQVAAGLAHTIGLRSDGTVVAAGDTFWGQCDISDWTDIIQVAAGSYYTVGLKSDGTVIATGYNDAGQCNISDWTDIAQVAAGEFHTVGIRSDGTVVAVGGEGHDYGQCNVELWTNITQIAAGSIHTVGLRDDGSVVARGLDGDGECSGVDDWDLINLS
jgi:hypothetical protein